MREEFKQYQPNTRLAHLLQEVSNPKKNAKNSHFGNTYVTLEKLLEGVLPLFADYGFRLHQTVIGSSFVTHLVDEETGDTAVCCEIPFVIKADTPQEVGSTITYARRYGLMLILNLVAEADDDAERGMGRGKKSASNGGAATKRQVIRR